MGVARTALSDGFSSAAELSAAVARVLARIRRREENERSKRRRLEMGGDAEQEGYPPLLAAAAALQDTVAAWEYALGKKEAVAGSGRLPGLGAFREAERRREGSPQTRDRGPESEGVREKSPLGVFSQVCVMQNRDEGVGQDPGKGGVRNEPGGAEAGVAASGQNTVGGQEGLEVLGNERTGEMEQTGEMAQKGEKGAERSEGKIKQKGEAEGERDADPKQVGTEGDTTQAVAGVLQAQAGGSKAVVGRAGEEPGKVHREAVRQEAGVAADERTEPLPEERGRDAAVGIAAVPVTKTGAEAKAGEKEWLEERQEIRDGERDEGGATTGSNLDRIERKGATGGEAGGWWAPECFSQLVEAILERYTEESERHGTVEKTSLSGGSVSAALESAGGGDEKRPGVEVDQILEVVAATNRRVQACLVGQGPEGKDEPCGFCQKHCEKRQEGSQEEDAGRVDLRPICLGPVRGAVRQLSAEVQRCIEVLGRIQRRLNEC